MRISIAAISLFALAVVVAACGGGGKSSGVLPVSGGPVGGNPPTGATTTRAQMVFKIPPANKQSSRKPFYISPGTQSFGVFAISASATASPDISQAQIFPVTTPSPCTSGPNGTTCTLSVVAPLGTDVFYVAAFAVASPGPNSIPLSEYVSGPVAVSLSPSPNATPMSFVLQGVAYNVAITVPSPDPSNTPNTQVFTVGIASAPQTLGITAYDSSNNVILADASTIFANNVTISVNPSNAGIGLLLSNSVCPAPSSAPLAVTRRREHPVTFSGGQPSVELTCAGDVNNVTFGYDGSINGDSNDHIIDTTTIVASQQTSPAPSPATVVLQSNVLTYPVSTSTNTSSAIMAPLANGQLLYVMYQNGGTTGTFTPSTQTATTPVAMSDVEDPVALAIAPNGTAWAIDSYATVDCWTAATSVGSGAAPSNTISAPTDPAESAVNMTSIVVDSANTVWITGYDDSSGQEYALYFPASTSCTTPTLSASNFVLLNGDTYDSSANSAPLNGSGIVYQSRLSGGAYYMTTANGGSSVSLTPAALTGTQNGGIATAANGAVYAAFWNGASGAADLETAASAGGAFSSLLSLLPNPAAEEGAEPIGLSLLSLNGVADRAIYADSRYSAMGVVGNLQTTPATMLMALPNAWRVLASVIDVDGGSYEMYEDLSYNLYLSRVLPTTTWNVPVQSLQSFVGCGTATGLLSIDQRAPSSGPFTVTVPGGTSTQMSGTYNDYLLVAPSPGPAEGTITIQDAGGRTETFPNISINPYNDC